MKNFLKYQITSSKKFILSFSISFFCLAVIRLILWVISLYDSVTAHSPSGKELNPSSQEDARFHGVAPGHAIFTSSYVIPLWDSATTHSPSAKKLKHSSQEDARFSMCSTLAYNFDFILCHPFLGLSNSSLTLP